MTQELLDLACETLGLTILTKVSSVLWLVRELKKIFFHDCNFAHDFQYISIVLFLPWCTILKNSYVSFKS